MSAIDQHRPAVQPEADGYPGDRDKAVPLSDFVQGAYRASLDPIIVSDLDGVIVDVNPAFELVTGHPREEALGRKVGQIVGTEYNRPLYPAMWDSLLATGTWDGELINRRRDGSEWVSQQRISLVAASDGRPMGYVSVARDVTEQRQAEERLSSHTKALAASQSQLEALVGESLLALARACEQWENSTGDHLNRVRTLAQHLAERLGFPRSQAALLGLAAVVHDIGKIAIPKEIVVKPGPLTAVEWQVMRGHTLRGLDILPKAPEMEWARQIVRHHHENFDGSGYPDGLKGEEIPLPARIVRVADSLDAMLSDRPYRPGRPLEQALAEIRDLAGRQFDPTVVEELEAVVGEGLIQRLYGDAG